jgi:hypothetical protein
VGPGARLLAAALFVTVVAEVAFIVWIPTFVTLDGATHVGGAALLRDVLSGTGNLHLEYVQLATFPAPNLLPEIALGTVMLVVNATTAEKLLQIAYVVALPLALLYAVRGVRHTSGWVALLALPMTFTFTFSLGLYDFSFGVVLFLIAAGYAWRHRLEPSPRQAIVVGVFALLLYLTHIVAYAEFVVFLGTIVGWRLLLVRSADGTEAAVRDARRQLWLLAGVAPSLALSIAFFVSTGTAIPATFRPLLLQVAGVLSLSLGLATYDRLEVALSVLLALSLLAACIAALRSRVTWRPREHDAALAFAILAALLAMIAPFEVGSGGRSIPDRLALFPVYGVALWLAGSRIRKRDANLAAAVWIAVALGFFAVRLPTYLALSHAAQEYVSVAPCVAEEATMIQVNLAGYSYGSLARSDDLTHEAGRIAAVTRGHDLGSFEGLFPFFLFHNRADNDPFRYMVTDALGFESVPPGVDLPAYALRPYGEVDYVIVRGRPEATADTLASPAWSTLSGELASDYRLAAMSSSGLVSVYERTGTPAAAAGASRRAATSAEVCHPAPTG